MNRSIETMLDRYHCRNASEYRNAMKEIIQEVALYGLSRTDFFDKAAFCGGTALRIFHGLERFSEDMDFSLRAPDPSFTFTPYLETLDAVMREFGFQMEVQASKRSGVVQSAFLKGNTLHHLLEFTSLKPPISGVPGSEKMTIKLEADTNPPAAASFVSSISLHPVPYQASLMDLPSLFAGKVHAILCRRFLKGRDLFDFVWYLQQDVPINLAMLESAMRQTGDYKADNELTTDEVIYMLKTRFASINYSQAKADTVNFLPDPHALDVWSADFFCALSSRVHASS